MSRDVAPSNDRPVQAGACVVLSREGVDVSSVLLRALTARGLAPDVVHDEPAAMVALAGLVKRDLSRRVLIVIEPTRWPQIDELADAVSAYHGAAHCWQFDASEGADPMLAQLQAGTQAGRQQAAEPGPVGTIRKRSRPVDRLLVSPGKELTTREVVTQQELTMLLGPAPGEAG